MDEYIDTEKKMLNGRGGGGETKKERREVKVFCIINKLCLLRICNY